MTQAQTKDVKVTVKGSGWNPIAWTQEVKTPGHGAGKNEIKFPHGSDNYDIIFTLDDQTGHDIRFDAAAPMFIERTLPGSPYPSKFATDQLMVESCDSNTLRVRNWNQVAMDLHYQLNFVTASGKQVNAFDPVILNGGGGVPPFTDM
jgi:hypothetical protein